MNYYYEVNLNFNDVAYYFYEWNINDKLEKIKKIPVVKVKTKLLKEIIANNFYIDKSFLEYISNKTICNNNFTIKNSCIFCDTKNAIAIEFDDDGKSIARSYLLLEDENNICDLSYSFKYYDLNIKVINKLKINNDFRQEENIKRIINKEIYELYEKKDYSKLEYLYYEWFNTIEHNREIVLKRMTEDLEDSIKKVHYKIYNIIKMSYSKTSLFH